MPWLSRRCWVSVSRSALPVRCSCSRRLCAWAGHGPQAKACGYSGRDGACISSLSRAESRARGTPSSKVIPMTHESYFLVALGVTVGVSALVAIYLRWPLRQVLRELCGTAERAAFWNVCCDIVLILLPIAALLIGRLTDRYSDGSPF